MKIKTDFITNSSSSTFVVAWPTKIKSLEDVKKYIWREDKARQVYSDVSHCPKPSKINPKNIKVVECVARELEAGFLKDLYGGNYKNMNETYDQFKPDFMNRHGVTDEEIQKNNFISGLMWKEYNEYRHKIAVILAKKFCKENEGNFLYIFSYGDSGEFMSEMEHGGTFNDVPHIQVSHH